MRNLVRRQRLGDRMIVAIGMLVAAAVAALLGFAILVANHVDQDSAAREMALAREKLVEIADQMKSDLAAFARWDEAVAHTNMLDAQWIHRHFGARLHEASGHDRSFILGPDNEPIYGAADGVPVDAEFYRSFQSKLEPLVRQVRAAHRGQIEPFASSDSGELGTSEPKIETAFRRIEKRPALIGATTIVPGVARAKSPSAEPAIAVSIAFLEEDLLQQFARELATDDVTMHDGDQSGMEPPEDKLALRVPLEAGAAPAWLAWTPRTPGATMLMRLLPALLGVAALLGMITLAVLRYVRRTTERLDHSERRATELAYRDRLTGLANRVQLLDTLSERLPEVRTDRRLALVLLDLDGFKDINDTLGHPTGDEVLFAVGERLTTVAGANGMAVRFGGDEFALLVPVTDAEEVHSVCRRLVDTMRSPIVAGGQYLTVSATIGAAVAPDDAHEPEQLLRRADIALYRAKAETRGGFRLFDPGYEEVLQKRSAVERDLSRAMASDELSVMFQPLFAADGERIVGAEALVRWNHPERGFVPPSEFIPIAEQTGLIVKIDEWVLRRACELAAHWPRLSLAVNLSASNFRQPHVAERLTRVLVETEFDPRRLEIEITESMLLGATGEVLGELSELRRIGVRIALDDFGTGYSSLGYLRRFPVDKLKIDKSFVQNLGITEDAAAIVECVTRLGRALGLAVTAEGVETSEQHRFVRAVGCHQVQGYLFSPPLDANAIDAMARREDAVQVWKPRLASA